nr:protein Turandot M-like [Drosophila kikkawai]
MINIQLVSISVKMNPAIYLNLLLFVSFGWTASVQSDLEFSAELTRLKNIYEDDSVTRSIKFRTIPDLMDFYEKYSDRLRMTPRGRVRADDALKVYKEEKAKQIHVDGVALQGLWTVLIFGKIDTILKVLYTQPDPNLHQNQTFITNSINKNN